MFQEKVSGSWVNVESWEDSSNTITASGLEIYLVTPMRADNVNGHLLFGTTGHDVVTTVCNGKVLMKDREVLVCDVDKVMADCRQSAQELADDINGGK